MSYNILITYTQRITFFSEYISYSFELGICFTMRGDPFNVRHSL